MTDRVRAALALLLPLPLLGLPVGLLWMHEQHRWLSKASMVALWPGLPFLCLRSQVGMLIGAGLFWYVAGAAAAGAIFLKPGGLRRTLFTLFLIAAGLQALILFMFSGWDPD